MKKNGLLKYSLIIIFIFIGLLFTSTICYAAGDNSNNNIPYCNYKYSGDLDGKDFSYDITIGYYQNKLGFYNQKTKKITDSLQVKGLYTVSISSDSKSALKASGTSFTCPSNVNMIFTSVDIMATTFKKSFNLTKDNSIIKAVDDGKNQNGNKLEKCSNEHLSQMKNELTSVYETYLYNPVKIKINEIDSLERYNNQDSNMNKTDISYLENMGQSTINFYNSILKGAYATKKKEVIQKYRESCTFDNNNSTLKSIQQKEEELASTIRTKLMNKRNIVKGWMQETGVDEATINQQNEQFNRQNKRNDGRKRKTSSEDTTIRIRKRGIERRERDFKLREQEIKRTSDKSIKRRDLSKGHENAERSSKNHRSGRETQYYQGFDKPKGRGMQKKRARELIKDEKEELDKKKKQNKRNFNILSAIVVIIGCITLLFSTFILHKANAIATPKKAELASISKIKKENRNLKASISSSERKQAQASSQAAAQKASESQAQAEIEASVKEQSDNDAKIGQLRKEIDELSDSAYPENHMPILPPEEVQRLKANFTRERYNQLLTELEQMKKEKKIGFKDSSDLQSELGLINDSLKKQGKQEILDLVS